jgi:hypothetical protein
LRLVGRVGKALEGVDEVLRHDLALLAFEDRIVGEVDAGAEP